MFPLQVKEQAMIACGRRCCLCHKFAGVGMECHHIIQEAEGGANTFENCIPLCFDCHAEVGHYNAKHPKGVKFSEGELRGHRDRWYAQVANGVANEAPADYLELDRALALKIVGTLGGYEQMLHFHEHDYGGLYPQAVEQRLIAFRYATERPDCQFFDMLLEANFAQLKDAILNYKMAARNRIWYERDGQSGIPQEWCRGEPAAETRFWEAVETMNKKANGIWDAYCSFIREARRRLRIEIDNS